MSIQSHDGPALTADVVLVGFGDGELSVLLIQRAKPPFQGAWAFPGGFVDVGEAPQDAAARELEEETGIRGVHLEQLRAFGDPGRDPRGHVVTLAYIAVMAKDAAVKVEAGSDAGQARWWSINDLPPLAFDHAGILTCALRGLRSRLRCPITVHEVVYPLPQALTLADLQEACSAINARLRQS